MSTTPSSSCFACFASAVQGDACSQCGAVQREKRNLRALPLWTEVADRYHLGKVLGAGGFGITYLAKDNQLGRRVALKEYFPTGLASRMPSSAEVVVNDADDEAPFKRGLTRFYSEGKHMARFTHPNIVCVFDAQEGNGTAYLVMQYHDGRTLKAELREAGRLACANALHVMQFVLDALKAVHRENLVHRDVKPDNIYLTESGRVLLLDFGGAKQLFSESERTASGDTMFAHGYAAPEQYFSDGDKINATTDVYGAAATLYHLLTGERMPGALERDRAAQLPWHDSDAPAAARAVVERALSLEQKDRYPSIDAFSDALAAAAPGTSGGHTPSTGEPATATRRAWLVGGASAMAGAAVASGAWGMLGRRLAERPAVTAPAPPPSAPVPIRNTRDRLTDMQRLAAKGDWRKVDDEADSLRQSNAVNSVQPDRLLLQSADTESERGNFARAQKLLEQAVLNAPGAAEPWGAVAFALMRQRKATEAHEAALQSLSLDATNPTAWSTLAEAIGDAPPGNGAVEAAQLAVHFSRDRVNMMTFLRESPFRSGPFSDIMARMGNRLDQVPTRTASAP